MLVLESINQVKEFSTGVLGGPSPDPSITPFEDTQPRLRDADRNILRKSPL